MNWTVNQGFHSQGCLKYKIFSAVLWNMFLKATFWFFTYIAGINEEELFEDLGIEN